MRKIVVYTAIFGDYDLLQDPIYKDDRFDFIYFSDKKQLGLKIWKYNKPIQNFDCPIKSNRFHKFFPHKLFDKCYQYSFYMDANFLIANKAFFEEVFEYSNSIFKMGVVSHPLRYCCFQELEECYSKKMISNKMYLKTKAFLNESRVPLNGGLFANYFLFRDMYDVNIQNLSEEWWEFFNSFCNRDQVFLPFLMRKYKIKHNFLFDSQCSHSTVNSIFIYFYHAKIMRERLKNSFLKSVFLYLFNFIKNISNYLGIGTGYFLKSLIKVFFEFFKFKYKPFYIPNSFLNYINNYHTELFISHLGYVPNFNQPRTLNEFINAEKQLPYDSNSIQWVDKIAVKSMIKNLDSFVKVPQLLSIGATLEEVLDCDLLTPFVIKANHDSGSVWVIRDQSNLNPLVKKKMAKSVKYVYGRQSLELQYQSIPRLLFSEEFLGDNLLDYKFFVFNGKVKFVQVDVDRFTNHTRCFYSTKWNKLPFGLQYPLFKGNISKPIDLDKIILFCESLNTGRSFYRGDFYCKDDQWYFGEITFSPGSGFELFKPVKYDALVWQWINGNYVKQLDL